MAKAKNSSELARSDLADGSQHHWQEAVARYPSKLRIPKWLMALLILGLIAGGGYVTMRQLTIAQRQELRRSTQTATAQRVNLPVTISANGTVTPERSANVSPKTPGILKRLLVKEGDRVEQGQILAYMDDSDLQGTLTKARGELAQAEADLQKAIAGNRSQDIAQAEAQLANDEAVLRDKEATFQQNQRLFSSGAISQRDFNTSLADRDSAKAQVLKSQQALDLQRAGSRTEDIAAARAQVLSAQGSLQSAQADINDTVIRAPFSGVITKKYADPGSYVTPSTAGSAASAAAASILALASTNQVNVNVAEYNISKIKLGQLVSIQVDAYPGKTFTGKVVQIAAQSTTTQNVTSFEVKTSISDPQNLLRSGMSTHVTFNVGTMNNALVIPTVAIVRQDNSSGVMVLTKAENGRDRPVFRPITTGVTVEDKTVVSDGLQEGERIMLSFPSGARPSSAPSFFRMPGSGGPRSGGGTPAPPPAPRSQ